MLQSPFTLDLWSDWAVSHLVCSSLFISLMDTFASRPLHPANNIASGMVKSQQMCLFVSPASASLAQHCCSLLSLCSSLGSWRAVIDHFLPVFPQKLTTTAAFPLRCVCLTTAFCSHCHLLLSFTSQSTGQHLSDHSKCTLNPRLWWIYCLYLWARNEWEKGWSLGWWFFYSIKRFSNFAKILHFKCLIQVVRLEIIVWGFLDQTMLVVTIASGCSLPQLPETSYKDYRIHWVLFPNSPVHPQTLIWIAESHLACCSLCSPGLCPCVPPSLDLPCALCVAAFQLWPLSPSHWSVCQLHSSRELCWMPELDRSGRHRGCTDTTLRTPCWQFNC